MFSLRTGNYSSMLGFGDNEHLTEYLRLYIALHGDHEGGNASAHTAREYFEYLCVRSLTIVTRPCWINTV